MSYCRFSNECDLYVYHSVGGIVIHTANVGKRYSKDCFHSLSHAEAIDLLHTLKGLGYVFPDSVIESLEEERDERS